MDVGASSQNEDTKKKLPRTLDDLHDISKRPTCSELINVSQFINSFANNNLATGAAFVYLRDTTVSNNSVI